MVIPEKRTLGSWGRPFSSSRAGSASHEPWLRVELEDPPKVFFDVASDTCLADVGHAGIGGFYHGLFWFYEVPEDVRFYLLPIPPWGQPNRAARGQHAHPSTHGRPHFSARPSSERR